MATIYNIVPPVLLDKFYNTFVGLTANYISSKAGNALGLRLELLVPKLTLLP